MAVILSKTKSTTGSPYAYYKVETTSISNRQLNSVKVAVKVTSNLASSSSYLGTGQSMGLDAYFTFNGKRYGPLSLKSTSSSWSGTSEHTATDTYTVTGLSVLQTSMTAKFEVHRTGTADTDTYYEESSALKTTSCSNITFNQAQAQSIFNSISQNVATNGEFSISATQYDLYDELTLYNGDPDNGGTLIKTISNIKNAIAYQFDVEEQTTLNALFSASTTSINLTARLTTYTDSSKTTNLGSTDKTMAIVLPAYIPTITLDSYTATDNYSNYKNNSNDVIKGISTVGLTLSMSNNYNNTYSSATCNGVSGTISGRTITFNGLAQADTYSISVTDSRGIVSTGSLDGSSYSSTIKTIQYTTGEVKVSIERTSPTGTTANVEVTLSAYDGTNFKTSTLEEENFTLTYTTNGTTYTIPKRNFAYNSGKYTYQLTNLNYKKEITWSISGTDKIGRVLNSNNGVVGIGLPVYNAFTDSGENYMVINGKLVLKTSTDTYMIVEPVIVDSW